MNNWTRICLVLLRLAIGWHFLFEGLEKLDSWYNGPAKANPHGRQRDIYASRKVPLHATFGNRRANRTRVRLPS